MGWTFYNANGQRLSTATTLIDNLDIDGATDIGAAIVDADLFIIDDGAGGTNRKTAASRIVTYIDSNASGSAKALAGVESDGTALSGNYNISATSTSATGKYTVTLDTDMSSTGYQVVSQVFEGHDTSNPRKCKIQALATGSFGIRAFTEGTSLVNVATLSAVFGDQ